MEFILIVVDIIITKVYALNVLWDTQPIVITIILVAMHVAIQIVLDVILLQVRHADNVKEDMVFYYI
jgi:predicted MFS family arabinose efflux permease